MKSQHRGRGTGCLLSAALLAAPAFAPAQQAASWSSDSRLVAVAAGPKAVEIYDSAGRLVWSKTFESRVTGLAISPDGARAAYLLEGEGLWIAELVSGRASLVHRLQPGDSPRAPLWSPDGRKVLLSFSWNDAKSQGIPLSQRPRFFLVNADGSGELELSPQ